jgi:hypothetical protein
MVDGLDCIKIRRDPEHLAAAIIDLARMEPAERTEFRQRVKRNARLTFDFERWFGKVMGLLEAAAASRCKPCDPPERILMSLALLTHIWRS